MTFLNTGIPVQAKDIWQRLEYSAASAYSIFAVQFFLRYTGYEKKIRLKRVFYAVLCIIPAILIYKSISGNVIARDFPSGFWYVFPHFFLNIYNISSLSILLIWAKKSKLRRNIRQASIIFGGAIATIVLTVLSDFIMGLTGLPSLTSVIALIFLGCIFYAMKRYYFLSLTPEIISRNLINSIDEWIVLLDFDGSVLFANDKTQIIAGNETDGKPSLTELIMENEMVQNEIKGLLEKNPVDFSCRCHIITAGRDPVLLDARFKTIMDHFNEPLGIMIIGREVKEINLFKSFYRITERQIDIIQHVISGEINKVIAMDLNITENTLKRHITNIYNKLNIQNKVELINLLKEHNIIPEQPVKWNILIRSQ